MVRNVESHIVRVRRLMLVEEYMEDALGARVIDYTQHENAKD